MLTIKHKHTYMYIDLVKVEPIHTMKNSNNSSPTHLSVSQQLLASDKAAQTLQQIGLGLMEAIKRNDCPQKRKVRRDRPRELGMITWPTGPCFQMPVVSHHLGQSPSSLSHPSVFSDIPYCQFV